MGIKNTEQMGENWEMQSTALKRTRAAPAEDTLFGGQFGGQGGEGAWNMARSRSAVDAGWSSMPWQCRCCPYALISHCRRLFLFCWTVVAKEQAAATGPNAYKPILKPFRAAPTQPTPQFSHQKHWWKQPFSPRTLLDREAPLHLAEKCHRNITHRTVSICTAPLHKEIYFKSWTYK